MVISDSFCSVGPFRQSTESKSEKASALARSFEADAKKCHAAAKIFHTPAKQCYSTTHFSQTICQVFRASLRVM